MEKVKIIACKEKGKTKDNKPWYQINLSDSRTPTGFDNLEQFVNQEIELEVFKNDKGYWAYRLPPKKKEAVAPKSNKIVALECAAKLMDTDPTKVLQAAELYLEWLNKE
jgi:hypothetical protein